MNIDEQDIFNYVFFPDRLVEKKKTAIANDESLKESLNFYIELLSNSAEKQPSQLKKKIADKIPAYSLNEVIRLYPLNDVPSPEFKNKWAAASETRNFTSKMMSGIFADENKEYMIKVLKDESGTKIFVFSTASEIIKDFDLIIEPKNIKFHLDDNSQPLVINKEIDIDSLRIELNG